MSSLIEVLKVIQEKHDLDSRTAARKVFDLESSQFESAMAEAVEENTVRQLAESNMLLSEYWMNQWVGSDPQWHGDWGKALRAAVKEIKAEAEEPAANEHEVASQLDQQARDRQFGPINWSGEAPTVLTDEQVDAAAQPVVGTVKIGRGVLLATIDGDGVVKYQTKKGEKVATDRIAKTFKTA
jgi:hypothetical protein